MLKKKKKKKKVNIGVKIRIQTCWWETGDLSETEAHNREKIRGPTPVIWGWPKGQREQVSGT